MATLFKQKKKWQLLVDKLYPADVEAGINSHQVSNLLHYASITPNKLPDIGKYLEKRAKEDIRKNRIPFVAIAMETFQNLLSTCQHNMAFFSPNIIRVLSVLFEDPRPKLQCIASETFIKFAESTRHTEGQQHQLDGFVEKFLSMLSFEGSDAMERKQMRVYGLRGLHEYIVSKNDIESFVSRWLSGGDGDNGVLGPILNAMLFKSDGESVDYAEIQFEKLEAQLEMPWSDEQCSVPCIATLCLRDLVGRLNNISIRPMLSVFLSYLDTHKLWVPEAFARHCVRTITNGIPQQRHLVQMALIRHVGAQPRDSAQKKSIIETLLVLMEGVMGPVIEILSSLLSLLIESAQSPNGTSEEEQQLQQAILNCIAVATKTVDTTQHLDSMTYILHRFRELDQQSRTAAAAAAPPDESDDEGASEDEEEEAAASTSPATASAAAYTHALRVLARSALVVSELLQPLPDSRSFPPALFAEVTKVLSHRDAAVREMMHGVVHHILLDGGWLQRATVDPRPYFASSGSTSQLLAGINRAILVGVQQSDSKPSNIVAIYRTSALIVNAPEVQELKSTLSLLFGIQERASTSAASSARSLAQRAAAHKLVAALLRTVACKVECPELAGYVEEVVQARIAASSDCPALELGEDGQLTLAKAEFGSGAKEVSLLFDQERVTGALSEIAPGLQEELASGEEARVEETKKKKKRRRRNHARNDVGGQRSDVGGGVGVRDIQQALYGFSEPEPAAVSALSFEEAAGLATPASLGSLSLIVDDVLRLASPSGGEEVEASSNQMTVFGEGNTVSLSELPTGEGSNAFLEHLSPLSTLNLQFPSQAFAV